MNSGIGIAPNHFTDAKTKDHRSEPDKSNIHLIGHKLNLNSAQQEDWSGDSATAQAQ